MGLYIALISCLKLMCHLYELPDLYTFFLAKKNKNFNILFIAPVSFLLDIIFDFYLGTFFLIDILAYIIWYYLGLKFEILLYFFRYFLLYFVGIDLFYIFNALIWGAFFILINKIFKLA